MTGRVTGLAMMVQANDLRDLVERAIILSYVISADQDALGRLEVARKRAVQLHNGMVKAEQARIAAEARVRIQLGELERVRAVRQRAKERLDGRVAKLAGAAAPCGAGRPSCGAGSARKAGPAAGRPWRRAGRRFGAAL